MHHVLKIEPHYYARIVAKQLTFYHDHNPDAHIQMGDTVELVEWNNDIRDKSGKVKGVTGSENLFFTVGYVEHKVLSLLPFKVAKPKSK